MLKHQVHWRVGVKQESTVEQQLAAAGHSLAECAAPTCHEMAKQA